MSKRAPIVVMVAMAVLLALTQVWPVAGQATTARPEDVGLSSQRFQRVNELMKRHVDAKSFSGAVTLVARRGKVVHLQPHGLMNLESQKAMQADGIFRIMSMTKPVVGVAILMLMEEGKVRLTDPASKFVPELKGMKVAMAQPGAGTPGADPKYYTVPADHEITVRELLTHTSGLVSGPMSNVANRAVDKKGKDTLADYIPRLIQTPLEFQPGTRWAYSGQAGFDLLLRIVEVASGQTADRFLKTRIFDPLGMKDTGFQPPNANPHLVALYERTPEGTLRPRAEAAFQNGIYFSGGGGLYSTAQDYVQFAQMLLNGGQLNGKRLLSDRTVGLMRSVFVPDTLPGRPAGEGYGLSVRVVTNAAARNTFLSDSSFGWSGAYGTHFWIDPKEELIGILMTQTPSREAQADFETAVMQTIASGSAAGAVSGTR
jgi:CubicO group peptidase (beta-lactamase class C family)